MDNTKEAKVVEDVQDANAAADYKAMYESKVKECENVVAQNKELQKRFNNAIELINTLLDRYMMK